MVMGGIDYEAVCGEWKQEASFCAPASQGYKLGMLVV